MKRRSACFFYETLCSLDSMRVYALLHRSLCCTVDKALPHTVSTDASLGSSLTADALSHSMSGRHKSMSLDLDNLSQTTDLTTLAAADVAASRVRRSTRSSSTLLGTDVQVVVAWLESFEDYLTFPVGELFFLVHFPVAYTLALLHTVDLYIELLKVCDAEIAEVFYSEVNLK